MKTLVISFILFFFVVSSSFGQMKLPEGTILGSVLPMFQEPTFLHELEVVKEQRDQIDAIYLEYRQKIKEIRKVESKVEVRNRLTHEVQKQALSGILDKILLPNQKQRFIQVLTQQKLAGQNGSYSKYLLSRASSEVSLGELQKKKLEKIQSETKERLDAEAKRFNARILDILKQEKKEVYSVLTDKQKESLDDSIGNPFQGVKLGPASNRILYDYLKRQAEKR